jgi:hypothetical protein
MEQPLTGQRYLENAGFVELPAERIAKHILEIIEAELPAWRQMSK